MKERFDPSSGCFIRGIPSVTHNATLALVESESTRIGTGKTPVLFFHGATVPTLMTSAYRIDGLSWFDALSTNGRPIYGLDLLGYGEADPYPDIDEESPQNPAEFGTGPSLIAEIDNVVDYLRERHSVNAIHICAISRGAIPAGYYCTAHSGKVRSLTLHGPITRQQALGTAVIQKYFGQPELPQVSHFSLSANDRYVLLRDDRPPGTKSPLEPSFAQSWARDYSLRVHGNGNKIDTPIRAPMGFAVDISNAWNDNYFDERKLTMPTLILRGEWDEVLTPAQSCQSLFEKIPGENKTYIQLPQATHSMMFEKCRRKLYFYMNVFLEEHD